MYGIIPDVRAKFTLLRNQYVMSGYRPVHKIGDYLTTGMHNYFVKERVEPGECVEGTITFITPEYYKNSLKTGMRIEFFEGSKLTGYAEILEIYNEIMVKR